MSNSKLYAVVRGGEVVGTFYGVMEAPSIAIAGAVTFEGCPVNWEYGRASLNKRFIETAERKMLPGFKRYVNNGMEFLTAHYSYD